MLICAEQQWDLNTGQAVRKFTAHGAQLAAVAVRPLVSEFIGTSWVGVPRPAPVSILPPNGAGVVKQEDTQSSLTLSNASGTKRGKEDDADSNASFDPLFDDEPEADGPVGQQQAPTQPAPLSATQPQPQRPAIAPKNAPPQIG